MEIKLSKSQWERFSEILGNFGILIAGSVVIPAFQNQFNVLLIILGALWRRLFSGILALSLQGNTKMDQLFIFYLTMAILGLAFAILVVFGRTEENSRKAKKTTTTS